MTDVILHGTVSHPTRDCVPRTFQPSHRTVRPLLARELYGAFLVSVRALLLPTRPPCISCTRFSKATFGVVVSGKARTLYHARLLEGVERFRNVVYNVRKSQLPEPSETIDFWRPLPTLWRGTLSTPWTQTTYCKTAPHLIRRLAQKGLQFPRNPT
jgi:hypothetical protein